MADDANLFLSDLKKLCEARGVSLEHVIERLTAPPTLEELSCGLKASYSTQHTGLTWTKLPAEIREHLVWCEGCGMAFERFSNVKKE